MPYPLNCIRGIRHPHHINNDGTVGSDLFYFESQDRGDGWKEESINWEDDSSVIKFTLNQLKSDGTFLFKIGVVVLPREEIDRLIKLPLIMGLLSYERRPIDDNPYHGNILLRANTEKLTMRQIAANLALHISQVIPRASVTYDL